MVLEPSGDLDRFAQAGHTPGERLLGELIEIGRSLVAEHDPETILDHVLEVARRLTGARYAALGVLDSDRRELEQFRTSGIDEERRAAIGNLPRGRGVLGLLIADPRPLRLDSVSAHPRSFGFPPGHPPMESFLGVPILIRGEAWGNLYLAEKDGGFDEADETAAVVLAEWTAIAINNARLYRGIEAQRDELERAVRELEATTEIARALGGETDLARILETIVGRGRALINARSLILLLVEGSELAGASGAGDLDPEEVGRIPIDGSLPGAVLNSRSPLLLPRIAPDLIAESTEPGFGSSALLVPLIFRGRPLGVLAALEPLGERPEFNTDDERVLISFAASAAIAVATAQTAAEDRIRGTFEAAERERARWARELHDESLQSLAGLRVILSAARRESDPKRVEGVLDQAVNQVDETIAEMRRLIADLRPPTLDELGVGAAVRSLIERLTENEESAVEVDLDIDLDYDSGRAATRNVSAIEEAVYRFVQEAMHNVLEHSRAKRVLVRIREADGRIALLVGDDGTGFDPGARTRGFGLLGMRERIESLGGSFEISSDPDTGTEVSAVLEARHRRPGANR